MCDVTQFGQTGSVIAGGGISYVEGRAIFSEEQKSKDHVTLIDWPPRPRSDDFPSLYFYCKITDLPF